MRCIDHLPEKNKLGYLDWHDKASVSYRKGERQRQCQECQRWFFPWELRPLKTIHKGSP